MSSNTHTKVEATNVPHEVVPMELGENRKGPTPGSLSKALEIAREVGERLQVAIATLGGGTVRDFGKGIEMQNRSGEEVLGRLASPPAAHSSESGPTTAHNKSRCKRFRNSATPVPFGRACKP